MPNDVVQANYDDLVTLAARFGQQAREQSELARAVRERAEVLQAGSWEGRGIEAFAAEMQGTVMPAMTRLIHALEDAQRQECEEVIRKLKVRHRKYGARRYC